MVAYKYSAFMVQTKNIALIILLLSAFLSSKAQLVELVTEQGTMKIRLYKDTPLHTANFLKNIKDGKYNNVLFHRVIKDFMIQSGDPASTKAKPGELLGSESGKQTIKAEILPNHRHKRGALAAARQPDMTNPTKASSQYQFYIVDGRDYTIPMLHSLENSQNRPKRYKVADSILYAQKNFMTKRQLDSLMNAKDYKTADKILEQMKPQTDSIIGENNLMKFTKQELDEYSTVGGAPNLDGKYTVFGEVIEGLEVIDLIAGVETDANSRPVNDIHILKITILEE